VRRVGIVSGGGGSALADAAALGLDALVTGEPEEPAMADAAETGVSFLACGHYATETFGVRKLGELLAGRFGVRHAFIEVDNPV
jgi:putative NIF3 family GTP cyclohydrolase 1 type 2